MRVRVSLLTSGLRVVTCMMPRAPSVSAGVWVGCGSRHEPASLGGISHFIEHMLFKGTRRRSAADISRAIEGRGGYLNAFTQEESTCYYGRVAREHLWPVFDVLADMYRNPRLSPRDVRKERDVVIEEIMMYRDEPEQLVQDMLNALLWQNHPLGRTLAGEPETLARIGRGEILRFRAQRYAPGNTIVAFAGAVDHDECADRVARAMRGLASVQPPAVEPAGPEVGQEGVGIRKRDTEQAHLEIGARVFGRGDDRRHALKLLSVILGENMSSRLFQTIRERHGLAYSINSSVHLFQDTGALIVSAGVERAKVHRVIELIMREIDRLMRRPVDAPELRRAKDYTIGQLRLGLESTSNQMMWAGESLLFFGRVVSPEEAIEGLRAVTPRQIRALAEAVFAPARMSAALIAPRLSSRDAACIRRALAMS